MHFFKHFSEVFSVVTILSRAIFDQCIDPNGSPLSFIVFVLVDGVKISVNQVPPGRDILEPSCM